MKRPRGETEPRRTGVSEIWHQKKPVIIVPLSEAPEAKAALPIARTISGIVGAKVHLLHVCEEPLSPGELMAKLELRREEMRELLLDRESGPPASAIAKVAEEKKAMLIAMATFGHRRPLSPTAEGVLKEAPCPLLFVRPESLRLGEQLNRILLPLDGTPTTAAAIDPALELATRSKARLDVLYVVEPGAPQPAEPGTLTAPRYIDQPQHEWPVWAREFLGRFCRCVEECPPASTRLFVRRGEPAKEILRFAAENDSDLVVLVWRGLFRGKRALTIKSILRRAPCPILVLRAEGR